MASTCFLKAVSERTSAREGPVGELMKRKWDLKESRERADSFKREKERWKNFIVMMQRCGRTAASTKNNLMKWST